MMKRIETTLSIAGLLVAGFLSAGPALGQIQAGPFTAFPSEDVRDARFLSAVSGREGLTGEATSVGLSVPAGRTEFVFRIFDGDTGAPCQPDGSTCFGPGSVIGDPVADPSRRGHWDEGTTPLCATIFKDPLRQGNTAAADEVGTWCSNRALPTSGPSWVGDPVMPDNGWWNLTVQVDAGAQSPGGGYFYHVVLSLDELLDDNDTVSNFKVAADVPLSVFSAKFGFEAGLAEYPGLVNDLAVIYPGFNPSVPNGGVDFLTSPTSYDGTYAFFLDVPNQLETITIWDGDFDYGTDPRFPLGVPSRVEVAACADTDDLNTPNTVPDFANAAAARPEGIGYRLPNPGVPEGPGNVRIPGSGNPADDNQIDFARRSPCVGYRVTDPLGNVFVNSDPSGNREWERFIISVDPAVDADVLVVDPDALPGGFLPTGLWKIEVFGLDLSNSNFWRFELSVCGVVNGEPLCPEEPVLIGDRVWYDFDGDGAQDSGEPGIAGVKLNRVGSSDSTSTVDDGLYVFDVLPGTADEPGVYTVEVASENFEAIPTGAVGDRVWLDLDGDGLEDLDEPGLANVDVRLSKAYGGVCSETSTAVTTTDVDGYYWFSGLPAGDYCTRVDAGTLPAGLAQSAGGVGGVSSAVTIVTDESYDTLDFGYSLADVTRAALGDRVWFDLDVDGVQDAGEAGIAGVRIRLYECGDPTMLNFETTDAGGFYFFGDLAPGCYEVDIDPTTLPAGFVPTFDYDGGFDGTALYVLAAGEIFPELDFGYVDTAGTTYCLTDRVWYDADASGLFGGSDEAIAAVTVTLRGAGGQALASSASGADGRFTFCGLAPSEYRVEITDRGGQLDGLMGTTQGGVDGLARTIVVNANVMAESFGYIDQGWLANCLWTTSPDPADGVLSFTPTSITDDISFDAAGFPANNLLFDLGCQPQGSIGDFIWLDLDGNGAQDGGEPGLGGVTVELRECSGQPITSLVTSDGTVDVDGDGFIDPLGFYRFAGLAPGCYRVAVDPTTLPAGVEQSYDLDGQLDDETELTVGINEDRDDADFGYVPLGSIGDRVWLDYDGDGAQDAGEPGLSGVRVELRDCADRLLDSAVTSNGFQDVDGDGMVDAPGYYLFSDLGSGCYQVVVVRSTLPAGARQTYDLDGVLDDKTAVELAGGEDRDDADFGYRVFGDGAGTPGFWKNHPEAWPVQEIYLGGVLYTKAEGMAILRQSTSGDMTYVLGAHLIAAKLNVFRATESSCITSCIEQADAWLVDHPIGSNVDANSRAWKEIEAVKNKLDRYNNGRLCAPSRG